MEESKAFLERQYKIVFALRGAKKTNTNENNTT